MRIAVEFVRWGRVEGTDGIIARTSIRPIFTRIIGSDLAFSTDWSAVEMAGALLGAMYGDVTTDRKSGSIVSWLLIDSENGKIDSNASFAGSKDSLARPASIVGCKGDVPLSDLF